MTSLPNFNRHHKPMPSHKFSIGCESDGVLVGAAICMRPACRALDDGKTLEVARLATDGTENACSTLYGRCARIAGDMGYEKIQTYILESESGTSLKATGWTLEKTGCGGTPQGLRTNRSNGHEVTAVTMKTKQRWAKILRVAIVLLAMGLTITTVPKMVKAILKAIGLRRSP
jgi:hypothetical protein